MDERKEWRRLKVVSLLDLLLLTLPLLYFLFVVGGLSDKYCNLIYKPTIALLYHSHASS